MVNVPRSMECIECHKPWEGRVSPNCLWKLFAQETDLFLGKVNSEEAKRCGGCMNVVTGEAEARRGRVIAAPSL